MDLRLPMPGGHNVSNATAAIAVAHRARHLGRGDPQGARRPSAASSAASPDRRRGTASRSSTTTATIRSRSPRCCKAARDVDQGPRHRRRPAAPLHPPARPVRRFLRLLQRCRHGHRRAGLCGRRGADRRRELRRSWSQRIRAGGHRDARFIDGPEAIAPLVARLAKPGDFVVFLGAGNITQWAYALPGELAAGDGPLHDDEARTCWRGLATGWPASAAASRRTRRWTRSPGSAPAGRPSAVPAGRRGRSRRLPEGAAGRICR